LEPFSRKHGSKTIHVKSGLGEIQIPASLSFSRCLQSRCLMDLASRPGGGGGGTILAPAYSVFCGGRVKVLDMGLKPEKAGAALQLLASELDILKGL